MYEELVKDLREAERVTNGRIPRLKACTTTATS